MRGPRLQRSYSDAGGGGGRVGAQCSDGWAVAAGAFLIQLTASVAAASYGVLALHLVMDGLAQPWQAAATPLLYVWAGSFTESWCRTLRLRRWLAAAGVVAAAVGAAVASLPCGDLLGVGVLAGVGASVASAQCAVALQWRWPAHGQLTGAARAAAQALGHFSAPLLQQALLARLGHGGAQLLLAGLTLQALVGVALLGPPRRPYRARERGFTIFGDVELGDLSPSPVTAWNGEYFYGAGGGSPLLGARGWRNPADEDLSALGPPVALTLPRSPVSGQRRLLPLGGVDILPRIPEESDEERDDGGPAAAQEARPESAMQRWSTVDGIDSVRLEHSSTTPLSRLRSRWPALPLRLQLLRQRLCCCFDLHMRFRCYWWCGGLASGFTRRLTYAAALQQVGPRLCAPLLTALTPLLARESARAFSAREAAFAAAMPAFARLCALLTAPCCARSSPATTAYLAGVSGLLAAAGLYVLLGASSHDALLLGAAITGLGEGSHIASGASFLDEADASILQSAIDILVGTFALLLVPLLGHLSMVPSGVSLCFVVVALIQVASSLVWLLRPLVQSITSHFQQDNAGNTEWRQCTDLLTMS